MKSQKAKKSVIQRRSVKKNAKLVMGTRKEYISNDVTKRKYGKSYPLKKVVIPEDRLVKVGTGCSMKIYLGNFQTASVSVWIEMPTVKENINKTFDECSKILDDRMKSEINDIKSMGLKIE